MTPSRTRRDRAVASLIAAAALGATACGPTDSLTAPDGLTCPSADVPLCFDPAFGVAVNGAVDDALTRLLPALENAETRATLQPQLGELLAALRAGDVARARASLATARATLLAAMRASASADVADLDAVELALDRLAEALGIE